MSNVIIEIISTTSPPIIVEAAAAAAIEVIDYPTLIEVVAPAGPVIDIITPDVVSVYVELQEIPKSFYSWDYFLFNTSEKPVKIATLASGTVIAYTLNNVTRYRLVPAASNYDYTKDAFYANFSNGVLSDLIAARG